VKQRLDAPPRLRRQLRVHNCYRRCGVEIPVTGAANVAEGAITLLDPIAMIR